MEVWLILTAVSNSLRDLTAHLIALHQMPLITPSQTPPVVCEKAEVVPASKEKEEEEQEDVVELQWPEDTQELLQRLLLQHLAELPPGTVRDDARLLIASQVSEMM